MATKQELISKLMDEYGVKMSVKATVAVLEAKLAELQADEIAEGVLEPAPTPAHNAETDAEQTVELPLVEATWSVEVCQNSLRFGDADLARQAQGRLRKMKKQSRRSSRKLRRMNEKLRSLQEQSAHEAVARLAAQADRLRGQVTRFGALAELTAN